MIAARRLVLPLLALLILLAPPPAATAAPKAGGVLKVALLRDPTGWDPHLNYGATTYSFQNNIYEQLVRHSTKGALEPALALRWETPDPTTYVFHLRKDVRFHSGNPFTADDVKFSIERILDPNTNATRAREFAVVQAVTVVDPATVRITLKQPSAPFLELLTAGEAVMIDAKWARAGGDFKKATSGTGPFKLGPFETGVRYSLVKNPDYWEAPLPYLDRIELSTIAKDEQRVSALRTGAVELAEYIPWQEIKTLEKDPAVRVHVGYDTFNVIRLNPKRPPFDNAKVRQAFNYLVDRKEIIDLAWGGIGRPFGAGLIPEGHWAFPRALQSTWSYDVARAKRLLAEAGLNPAATKLTFDSTTLSVHMDSAQIIVTQLQRAGFTQVDLEADGRARPAAEAGLRRVPADDGRLQPAVGGPGLLLGLLRDRRGLLRPGRGLQRRGTRQAPGRGPGDAGPSQARGDLRPGRAADRRAGALGVPPLATPGRGDPGHHRRLRAPARSPGEQEPRRPEVHLPRGVRRGDHMQTDTPVASRSDLDTLLALNRDYIRSVQTSDVRRFDEILADDFLCSNPDGSLIDRDAFLAQTARPVSISNLETHDVNVRLMGDFAIIHARTTYTRPDGGVGSGRYTDVWARRPGGWLAVSAHVTRC